MKSSVRGGQVIHSSLTGWCDTWGHGTQTKNIDVRVKGNINNKKKQKGQGRSY